MNLEISDGPNKGWNLWFPLVLINFQQTWGFVGDPCIKNKENCASEEIMSSYAEKAVGKDNFDNFDNFDNNNGNGNDAFGYNGNGKNFFSATEVAIRKKLLEKASYQFTVKSTDPVLTALLRERQEDITKKTFQSFLYDPQSGDQNNQTNQSGTTILGGACVFKLGGFLKEVLKHPSFDMKLFLENKLYCADFFLHFSTCDCTTREMREFALIFWAWIAKCLILKSSKTMSVAEQTLLNQKLHYLIRIYYGEEKSNSSSIDTVTEECKDFYEDLIDLHPVEYQREFQDWLIERSTANNLELVWWLVEVMEIGAPPMVLEKARKMWEMTHGVVPQNQQNHMDQQNLQKGKGKGGIIGGIDNHDLNLPPPFNDTMFRNFSFIQTAPWIFQHDRPAFYRFLKENPFLLEEAGCRGLLNSINYFNEDLLPSELIQDFPFTEATCEDFLRFLCKTPKLHFEFARILNNVTEFEGMDRLTGLMALMGSLGANFDLIPGLSLLLKTLTKNAQKLAAEGRLFEYFDDEDLEKNPHLEKNEDDESDLGGNSSSHPIRGNNNKKKDSVIQSLVYGGLGGLAGLGGGPHINRSSKMQERDFHQRKRFPSRITIEKEDDKNLLVIHPDALTYVAPPPTTIYFQLLKCRYCIIFEFLQLLQVYTTEAVRLEDEEIRLRDMKAMLEIYESNVGESKENNNSKEEEESFHNINKRLASRSSSKPGSPPNRKIEKSISQIQGTGRNSKKVKSQAEQAKTFLENLKKCLNWTDNWNMTVFHYLARDKHIEVFELLVQCIPGSQLSNSVGSFVSYGTSFSSSSYGNASLPSDYRLSPNLSPPGLSPSPGLKSPNPSAFLSDKSFGHSPSPFLSPPSSPLNNLKSPSSYTPSSVALTSRGSTLVFFFFFIL